MEAVAISGGRVVLAGARAAVEQEAMRVRRRLDLSPDRVVMPGLTDGHLHLADLALSADAIDLAKSPTLEDGLRRVVAAAVARPHEAWLVGQGWDPVRWGGWPTAADLERAAPGRRVALWSHDHHALWASESALRSAAVTAATDDPPGGIVRRLDDGSPAGCLHENAVRLVLRDVPAPSADRLDAALARTCRELIRRGVVAVHDPGEVSADVELGRGFAAYERLGAAGHLPIRIHASVRAGSLERAIALGLRSGQRLGGEGSRARMGWLKLFADGTLGARTARMLAPYVPDTERGEPPAGPLGMHVTPPDELVRLVGLAAEQGIAAQVHAIGDGAVRTALSALEESNRRAALMPRIEHAQLVDPLDLPRFARGGIAACVQPRDIRSDRVNAWRSWGRERIEHGAYAYRSLASSGAVVFFGTDAPVEPPDPWPAIASAVTRRSPDWPDDETFVAGEALPLDRAIRAACIGAAVAAGEPDRGRLVPGSQADLIVLEAAALAEPVEALGALELARPDLVLLGGQPAYEA